VDLADPYSTHTKVTAPTARQFFALGTLKTNNMLNSNDPASSLNIREYFALEFAKALLISPRPSKDNTVIDRQTLASWGVSMADKLIKELDKEQPE
jgi:hypothetical protein